MHAAAAAFGIALEPRDLALLCQQSENLVAGAPCGVMDQMTCVFGERDALLALLCQPAELQPSGAGARTTSSSGGSIRASVTRWAGPTTAPCGPARSWGCASLREHAARAGRLSGQHHARRVRARAGCAVCRRRCPATTSSRATAAPADTVTTVERGRRYRVRAPTAHPVYERQRAESFRQLLRDVAGRGTTRVDSAR